MTSRRSLAILIACLAAPAVAVAQVPGGDVTLKVPLNLTKLSTEFTKVMVYCQIDSTALRYDEQGRTTTTIFANGGYVPVSNGQLVTTVSIVFSKFSLMSNPAGVTATYSCFMNGVDRTGLEAPLTDSRTAQTYPQFKLTPPPVVQRGTFTW